MLSTLDAGLVWLRRDLRLDDNPALFMALQRCRRVYCCFVFDRDILDPLPRIDRRVSFIHASLLALDRQLVSLVEHGRPQLLVRHGHPVTEIPALARALGAQAVFAAHDYEPAALERDARVAGELRRAGTDLLTCKDHVIFERREILSGSGQPYSMFTPYQRTWLQRFTQERPVYCDLRPHATALAPLPAGVTAAIPSLASLGFEPADLASAGIEAGAAGGQRTWQRFLPHIAQYDQTRDYPDAEPGVSQLGIHLRFGTLSVRALALSAHARMVRGDHGAGTWLKQLIWRDFFFQILSNHPEVATRAFRPEYDAIRWEDGPQADAMFEAWCAGRTGYPLVDAAMRQLNHTGYMHNRLRMLSASFLVKHLGIDWRRGEQYFARQLNDFELASNNGNWQWASSSGCDAQPWFRIFNPVIQSRKFDPQGRFILRFLPELAILPPNLLANPWLAPAALRQASGYPPPLVDHDQARALTLKRYAVVRRRVD